METEQIIVIAALIMSIVIHEMAHGYAANWLGDPTARLQGRLSANPLVHIDPLGSVIIPALLFLTGSQFLFGWAKPVPYNPYNLSDQRYGEAKVAAAGPISNLVLALIFATLLRFADPLGLDAAFQTLAAYIVYINILLALFNMIPFPPLDGSKIVSAVLPVGAAIRYQNFIRQVEQYGFIILFVALFLMIQVLWPFLAMGVDVLATTMTGFSSGQFWTLLRGL